MRPGRSIALLLLLASPACARVTGEGGIDALAGRRLVLGSAHRVVSVDAGSGAIRFQGTGVPALGSWSSVFTTTHVGSASILEGRDALTGEVTSSLRVPGRLDVRVVSHDGRLAALMAPLPEGEGPWTPRPRTTTEVVVAEPSSTDPPRTFALDGNFEPEAFSTNGRSLYLISFVPPAAPEAYRVTRLGLDTGELHDVNTGVKGVVETMAGTRLEQIADIGGGMLHTLYSTAPAASASHPHEAGRAVSFVHMLSLTERWAHCLALPKPMWGGDPQDQAMAASPDGTRLYVADAAADLIAEVDTTIPETVGTASVELPDTGSGPVHATVTGDGLLLVSRGTSIVTIDTAGLERIGGLTTEEPVLGIGSDRGHLYVAIPGRVEVLEGDATRLGALPSPVYEELAFVGSIEEA